MNTMHSSLDVPSPAHSSMPYIYGDNYLDASGSDSQSPLSSAYDISYMTEFAPVDAFSTPEDGPSSPDGQATSSSDSSTTAKTPVKRKRENRYKNAPPSVLSRRRAQNRASQRAYRERKDQRIKDLEQLIDEAKQRNDTLSQAYTELHAEYIKLKTAQFQDAAAGYSAVPNNNNMPMFDPSLDFSAEQLDMDLFAFPDMNAAYSYS